MSSPDKASKILQAKLKKLDKLARATAKLAVEVFGDLISGNSNPVPPKLKKSGVVVMAASSIPVPPRPKFETLALIADGALTIGQGVEDLASENESEQ